MPESSLVIRLDSDDAEDSSKALTKSLARLEKQGDAVNDEFADVDKTMSRTSKAFRSVSSFAAGVGKAIAGLSAGFVTLGAVVAANTKRQESALSAVESRIVSTGKAAGFTTEELAGMASGFQKATAVGDEEILEFQSVLLTFTQITGDAFEGATEAVLNMATVMGTDFRSAAVQVGKALNDPIKGVNAMTRAGVQFSDSQKELIKNLVESGRVSEAQAMILKELEVQFGGAAAAAKNTFAGALQSVQNAFGDLLEAKGGLNDATGSLLELEKILSRPETVAAANTLTSALIEGFNLAVKAIVATVDAGRSLGDFLFDLTSGTREEGLQEQLDDVNEKIEAVNRNFKAGGIPLKTYQIQLAGLNEEAKILKEQLEGVQGVITTPTSTAKPVVPSVGTPSPSPTGGGGRDTISESQKLINSLKQQADTIGLTNRELQLYKLNLENATPAQIAQANALLDTIDAKNRDIELTKQQAEADELAIEAVEEQNRLIEERNKELQDFAAIVDPVLAVEKQRVEETEKLNTLLATGVISQEAYNLRLQEFADAAKEAAIATGQLTDEQLAFEGAQRALEEYAEQANDTFNNIKNITSNAFKGAEDALVKFTKTGKLEFDSLIDSILEDIVRLNAKKGLSALATGVFGGGSTAEFGPPAPAGLGNREGGGFLSAITSLFGFQRGGSLKIPGGGVDNQLVMFRGKAGERIDVSTPAQQQNNRNSGAKIYNIDFNINGVRDFSGFQQNKDQINNDFLARLRESERNL